MSCCVMCGVDDYNDLNGSFSSKAHPPLKDAGGCANGKGLWEGPVGDAGG